MLQGRSSSLSAHVSDIVPAESQPHHLWIYYIVIDVDVHSCSTPLRSVDREFIVYSAGMRREEKMSNTLPEEVLIIFPRSRCHDIGIRVQAVDPSASRSVDMPHHVHPRS